MNFTSIQQKVHRKMLINHLLKVSPADFCMSNYSFDFVNTPAELDLSCGTAGCALGHAPVATMVPALEGEGWSEYGHRVLGILDTDEGDEADIWDWCFCSAWKATDNSPGGAALRLQWLENHGLPEDWNKQMYGTARLCYVE